MSQVQLQVGADAVATIVDDVRRYGGGGVETGSLLLTPRGEPTASVLALAGEAGVTRHRGLFVLSAAALSPLFDYAEDNDLQVRAQVHSHRFEAFLSPTDKAGNIRMHGFIAAVIPTFATPSSDVAVWGWWVFEGAGWIATHPAIVSDLNTKVLTFDADGVHEH
jgi:hypothetical protein